MLCLIQPCGYKSFYKIIYFCLMNNAIAILFLVKIIHNIQIKYS